jgi:hypothetical protein
MMEQNQQIQEDLGSGGKFKNWLQDNIRIILSVLIVLAIAGGIYSYSKRTELPSNEEIAMQENLDQSDQNDQAVTIIGDENEESDKATENTADNTEEQTTPTGQEDTKAAVVQEETQAQTDNTVEDQQKQDVRVDTSDNGSQASISEETGEAFIETAVAGDSKTTLSRKALKNYLEKNNDSSLTAEHKIYIEDYLRRRLGGSAAVKVGQQETFSKNMIKDAIEKSKTLNESQLNNLKKYSARVSTI